MREMTPTVAIFGGSSVLDVSFLPKLKESFFTIACDSGYLHFLKAKIEPDLLVGDFDTLDQSVIKNPGMIIKLNPIKDDTDVFWAVKYALDHGVTRIELYGCLGQKLDHTIGNIQILSYLKDQGIQGYLYTPDNENVAFILENESLTFKPNSTGSLSVFSYNGKALGVSETNLKYTLDHQELSNSVPLGVSNEFIPQNPHPATVSVENGRLLIVAPRSSLNEK